MKYEKKCVLLMLVMSLFGGINVPCFAEDEDDFGDCGENVHWTFESRTGIVTISGTGEMDNFSSSYSPFQIHKNSINSVIIETNVTSIGSWVFNGCNKLTSINISNSVTSIGSNAFFQCKSLIQINIPESVSSIGTDAFSECISLESVFYQGSNFISNSIFSDDLDLKDICVSPDYNYNYNSFGGRDITPNMNCFNFQSMFSKCYMGAYVDNEIIAVKRKEFIDFEKQSTGCIEFTCNDETGLTPRYLCKSTETKTLMCMNDQCVEDKSDESLMHDKVRIEIEIEKGWKATDITSKYYESLRIKLGIEKGSVSMAYECGEQGNVLRIILFANEEEEANEIATKIKSLCM